MASCREVGMVGAGETELRLGNRPWSAAYSRPGFSASQRWLPTRVFYFSLYFEVEGEVLRAHNLGYRTLRLGEGELF